MQVVIDAPVSYESIGGRRPASECPTLDVRGNVFESVEITDFVLQFAAFFYERTIEDVGLDTRLEDLEVYFYTDGLAKPLTYGKLFVDPENLDLTGLSDRFLSVFEFFCSLKDAIGLEVTSPGEDPDLPTLSDASEFIEGALRTMEKVEEH